MRGYAAREGGPRSARPFDYILPRLKARQDSAQGPLAFFHKRELEKKKKTLFFSSSPILSLLSEAGSLSGTSAAKCSRRVVRAVALLERSRSRKVVRPVASVRKSLIQLNAPL